LWVGNVYVPPVQSLQKRGLDEDVVRSLVEDIVSCIPHQATQVVCGDWNTRIGNLSPTIEETTIPRQSEDKKLNARAPWLIELCEQHEWYILNGLQPGPQACNTFQKGSDKSCIDLIMTNTATQSITYDPGTLKGLSDHVLVKTQVRTPYIISRQNRQNACDPQIIYKWVEGTCVNNYMQSAHTWLEFSQ
jgi:hypothetical protein